MCVRPGDVDNPTPSVPLREQLRSVATESQKPSSDWMVLETVALEYLTSPNRTGEPEVRGEVSVQVQRRRKNDNRWSGPFVNLKIGVGQRSLFLHPDLVGQLQDALERVAPKLADAEAKLRAEADERRQGRVADWEKGLAGTTGSSSKPQRQTGKTDRQHAKGKTSDARKKARSEQDKALRSKMRGRG